MLVKDCDILVGPIIAISIFWFKEGILEAGFNYVLVTFPLVEKPLKKPISFKKHKHGYLIDTCLKKS